MAKKKSSAKSKKTTKNVVKANDIDINNIDSMFEDMKKLVLDNEKKTQPIEENVTEINVEGENAENTTIEVPYVLETENVETFETLSDEETTTEVQEEIEEVVETTENEETKQEENQENEIIIDDSSNGDIDKLKEELDKEEEQKEQETKQQEEEKPKENKRRRMTYEEVFGHRWMGYGYTSYT